MMSTTQPNWLEIFPEKVQELHYVIHVHARGMLTTNMENSSPS